MNNICNWSSSGQPTLRKFASFLPGEPCVLAILDINLHQLVVAVTDDTGLAVGADTQGRDVGIRVAGELARELRKREGGEVSRAHGWSV